MSSPVSRRRGPLRVLHLRDTDRLCGPGKTIRETVRLNSDVDVSYEVAAFGAADQNPFLRAMAPYCPVFGLPDGAAGMVRGIVEVARHIRRENIALIHAHEFRTDVLSVLVGALTRVPVVTTLHGFIPIDPKRALYRQLNLLLMRRMRAVFAVSRAMERELVQRGLNPARIKLVRNCIALESYPAGYRSHALRGLPGLAEPALLVGHVGRMSAEKGQRELAKVFPQVLAQLPHARLIFVGDGPDVDLVRELAARGAAAEAIRLLGYRNDIKEIFGDLDLLVLNSTTEGLPNVVLEAMALGVPVVATSVGGTPELIQDGATGWLVPVHDSLSLVEAIVHALSDRQEARQRAARGRRTVESEFDMPVLIRRTHEIYRELLGRNGGEDGRTPQ